MYQIILSIHVLIAIMLVVLVLIQHGKGADIGASFGSGASSTVFGSQGSGSFLFKFTGGLAAGFFATSLILGYMINMQYQRAKQLDLPSGQTIPVTQPNNGTEHKPLNAPVTKSATSKHGTQDLNAPLNIPIDTGSRTKN